MSDKERIAELIKDRDYWKAKMMEENRKWLWFEFVEEVLDKFGVPRTFKMGGEDAPLKPYQRIQELGMRAVKAKEAT